MTRENIKNRLRPIVFILVATGLITGCDRAVDAAKTISEPPSDWKYSETVDKMSQSKEYTAELSEVTKEVPLVQTTAKVICTPGAADFSFHIELTTYYSKAEPNGTLKAMPMKMESIPANQQGMFTQMLLETSGTIPKGTGYSNYTLVKIRTNENKENTQFLDDIPSISIKYNNQVYLFPFLIEKANGTELNSLRIAINTDQGTPNILIPFADKNVARVISACSAHRISFTPQNTTAKPPLPQQDVSKASSSSSASVTDSQKKEQDNTSQNTADTAQSQQKIAAGQVAQDQLKTESKEIKQSSALKPIHAPAAARDGLTEMLRNAKSAYKISEIKAQIELLPKPVAGDRRVARKLNDDALAELKVANHATAAETFKKALESDPADIEIRNNYLYALIKAKKYSEAEPVAGELLAISPGRSSAWANLAELYSQTNRNDESIAALVLAFQFSSNKDRTLTFLNENIGNENSPLHKQSSQALQIIKTL